MLFLGHLGIGGRIGKFVSRDLPFGWLLLGTILPDVIDKSLYHGLVFLTGKHGAELGLFCGTRCLGHSGILFILLLVMALFTGSRPLIAVCLGMFTHLLIDVAGDSLELFDRSASARAILYPVMGPLYVADYASVSQHVSSRLRSAYVIVGEIVGLALLIPALLTWKHNPAANRAPNVE